MISVSISPTQSDVQTAVGQFLQSVLPSGVDVIAAQPNMVAEPKNTNFVMMSPISFSRLATNNDGWKDVVFTGTVSGQTMTITAAAHGTVLPGSELFGINVPDGTAVLSQTSGSPGGVGIYQINSSFTISTAQTLSSGNIFTTMPSRMIVQLDFHSADYSSAEMAQTVAALFRDEYGTRFFHNLSAPFNQITPFYADDPKKMPFINDQQQYEWRWCADATMQINQTIVVPQQFMDDVKIGRVPVDNFFKA